MKQVLLPFYLSYGGTLVVYHLGCQFFDQTSLLPDGLVPFLLVALMFTLAYVLFRRLARDPRRKSSGGASVIDPLFRKVGFVLVGFALFALILVHVMMIVVPKTHAG